MADADGESTGEVHPASRTRSAPAPEENAARNALIEKDIDWIERNRRCVVVDTLLPCRHAEDDTPRPEGKLNPQRSQ
jgi:hypothetical protein